MPSNDYLRIPDIERDYGIPAGTLRHWRHTGRGPKSGKIGRWIIYRRADIEAWIEQQIEGSDQEPA